MTGDVKYIKDYEAYPEDEADGNFFPIVLDDSYIGEPITVKRTSGETAEKTVADTKWILRLTDGTATKYEISSGKTRIANLNFDGATLAAQPEMSIGIEKLSEDNVPKDENEEQCKTNQGAITVSKAGNVYNVSGDLSGMQEYESTDAGQKDAAHKWFGLIIATGESDIKNVTVDDNKLTEKDIADAESVSAPAGSFILWLKADVVKDTPRELTLKADGKADTKIKITFEDTSADG